MRKNTCSEYIPGLKQQDGKVIDVPNWLRSPGVSEVWGNQEVESETNISIFLQTLPTCLIDCMDGVLYYKTYGAWCVNFNRGPKKQFLRAWVTVPKPDRESLLAEFKYFTEELDVDDWFTNMVTRDDAEMLQELLRNSVYISGVDTHFIVEMGAVKCARIWIQMRIEEYTNARSAFVHDHQHPYGTDDEDEDAETEYEGDLDSEFDNYASEYLRFDEVYQSYFCETAARNGDLAMLAVLRFEFNFDWDEQCFDAAVKNGHLECLQFLKQHNCPLYENKLCHTAATSGHLECLKFLREIGCSWGEDTFIPTVENGHLDCLKYMSENGYSCGDTVACERAAFRGHLDCLIYLHEHGCPISIWVVKYAAESGHLNCLQYAHEHINQFIDTNFLPPHNTPFCTMAASENGHLDCLQYLYDNGYSFTNLWDRDICTFTAKGGHFECLKFICENGYEPRYASICYWAAYQGDLPMLTYAHEHGFPWDKSICEIAANHRHFYCLQYAFTNGCPW